MATRAEREHKVSVRDLRNHAGQVLDRVVRGDSLTVTKDGAPVAVLRPVGRRSLPTTELIARARRAPRLDAEKLRHDVNAILDEPAARG